MLTKELLLLIPMISAVFAVAIPVKPNLQLPIVPVVPQPVLLQPVAQARTFGSLFGSSYGTSYRYPDGQRGYPNYGSAYGGSVYGNSASVVPQPGYGGAYGGYGWRGGSDNRGYGQSGWANQAQSGWSGNYGR